MASEHTAFSTSGEDAIARTIEVDVDETVDNLSLADFEEYYEISRTVEEIINGEFKRIALQFPDELLRDSVPIYRLLKSKIRPDQELYVLADTSYGSCCVDEVAAQHIDANAMVHYGHACMSQTSRLPVIYVFGKKSIDVDDCASRLVEIYGGLESTAEQPSSKRAVLLQHDVAYTHQADAVADQLRQNLASFQVQLLYAKVPTKLDPPASKSPTANHDVSSAQGDSANENCPILYIGGESLGLTNLLVTHASSEVYSYDPKTKSARLESARTNKLLMRRYAVVQKARDADVFGILVGTLGVASYLPLISHLRNLLARSRKKSYTISVGKLNPAKLANFMEIECFVLVACPENSLIEAKDFLRPIVTPYELEVALKAEQRWTGRYVLDFEKLLSDHVTEGQSENNTEDGEDPDQPTFSLVTGKYRHAKQYGDASGQDSEAIGSSAVVLRNKDDTVSRLSGSAAGHFLQSRTYQGLETRLGEDAPSILEQGRSGIAKGYRDDHKENL